VAVIGGVAAIGKLTDGRLVAARMGFVPALLLTAAAEKGLGLLDASPKAAQGRDFGAAYFRQSSLLILALNRRREDPWQRCV